VSQRLRTTISISFVSSAGTLLDPAWNTNMPTFFRIPFQWLLAPLLLAAFAVPLGCRPASTGGDQGKQDSPATKDAGAEKLPPATPGLELQEEDYAAARGRFHTKLLRKGPAPQPWQPVKRPAGVAEVEYTSGGLRLRAWVNQTTGKTGKLPAILYLHGGWAFGADDWEQAQPLRDAGFVVMTPLLRGENGQVGNFTMFYDEIDDVLAAADQLARLPQVDPQRIYVAGHSAGGTHALLAAMASNRFRAAVSLSGSPDQLEFVRSGWEKVVPFDQTDIREFQLRSPVAYATSFKCPTRLYVGGAEAEFHASTRRTALLAKERGLDVEVIVLPGDHFSAVPEALRQTIAFFRKR
jgi:dipeptidyl aminopeptidase/acylaminoacyl peptidase